MVHQIAYFDRAGLAQFHLRPASGEQVYIVDRMPREARLVRRRTGEILAKVDLAALQHLAEGSPTDYLDQFNLHIRIMLRVAMQKVAENAFNKLGRGRDLEHSSLTTTQRLRPLPNGTCIAEQRTVVAKHLLA